MPAYLQFRGSNFMDDEYGNTGDRQWKEWINEDRDQLAVE